MPNFNYETTVVMSGGGVWRWNDGLHGYVAKIDYLLVHHGKYRNVSLRYVMKYICWESIPRTAKRGKAAGIHHYSANLKRQKHFGYTRDLRQ